MNGARLGRWLAVLVAFVGLSSSVAHAQAPVMTAADLATFNQRLLPPADPSAVTAALGAAARTIEAKEHVNPGQFRAVSIEAIDCVMERAVARHLSLAQLFTDRLFGVGGGLAIVIDGHQLAALDRRFALHSLFPVAVTTVDGHQARMRFLLAGNGLLIIGYDRGGEIEHPEAAYHLHGGHYELAPLIRMELDVTGRRAFANVATLPRLDPAASYEDFVGPLDSKLRGMVIGPDGIAVQAKLSPWLLGLTSNLRVKAPAIERRAPFTAAEVTALGARGCPVDGPWGHPS